MPLPFRVFAFTVIIREAASLNLRKAAILVRASSGILQSVRGTFGKLL